jgi:decaprenylphospho-beta-D-erythro-pentofuranosid-2-ulose 2-reductase
MSKRRVLPTRILVLGATSAIAMAVERKLLEPGSHFFLVGRNADKLIAVERDLTTRGAASVTICAMDLDDTAAHLQMLEGAVETLGEIDLALIAHGVLGDQEQAQASYTEAEAILRTNFLSTVSLITWLANYFERRKCGTLAVISSVAGDRGRKSNYVYGASKGALNIFLDGVRNRIDRAGVHVLTIRPGFVATPMTAHLKQGPLFASPEQVAQGITAAIAARKDVAYIPGFWAPIMFVIKSVPERIFKKLNL